MALKLRVLAGPAGDRTAPSAERVVDLDEHLSEIRLGRRAGLEVELPFPALSPIHARLLRRGAGWVVEDLGSVGGSWLGGVVLAPGEPRAVVPGGLIRVGSVSIVFEGIGAAVRGAEGTTTIARRLVSDLFGARADGEVPRLIPVAGWPSDRAPPPALRFAVPERPHLIGRGETCDLVLPTDDVSREHAVLVRRWAGIHIRDLDSKNGVRVGGQAIAGEHRLRDGDRIEIGSFELRLDDPEDRYLRALEAPVPEMAEAPAAPEVWAEAAAGVVERAPRVAWVAVAVASVVLLAIAGVIIVLIAG
jgi:pSer/pThr/pTyr-binding forkhead associated (FHA) protein